MSQNEQIPETDNVGKTMRLHTGLAFGSIVFALLVIIFVTFSCMKPRRRKPAVPAAHVHDDWQAPHGPDRDAERIELQKLPPAYYPRYPRQTSHVLSY
ncbi:hypothetical protein GLAREA_06965 [Glarea lozoyensis ATCC 20868]|uniref:Uncharacterized protein n=1 Tax=Glarea lozoyensis (strain ATCC 20868 / MF5171) TaxID=1116229 RepID=S3D656_GLAL2|nr:uncharacterized protein GLAREA_06965 [Glarea lozoyensis ATCC 20868]EPE33952.1 hypothetical protein GLAREA_06965 [Glarea lozoyensis ATCC 20868]